MTLFTAEQLRGVFSPVPVSQSPHRLCFGATPKGLTCWNMEQTH